MTKKRRKTSAADRETQTTGPPPVEERPGRNAPCWCGSGKKHKKCHLKEDEQHDWAEREHDTDGADIGTPEWKSLGKRSRRAGGKGPIGTVILYGPDDRIATKVVASVVTNPGEEPLVLERWFSEDGDVRNDADIARGISSLFKKHHVRQAVIPDRILGCPHEEGFDYPEGESCLRCPFWEGRDRWSGEYSH